MEYYECPNRLLDAEALEHFRLCCYAERGLWPVPGGAMDQPARFLKLFEVFSNEKAKIEEEEFERWRAKHSKSSSKGRTKGGRGPSGRSTRPSR
ncbi:MAG: hypothetical protein DHS20C21_18610 [Gemmatimonadota bacterium]|nr:MAG: hypothetical protein DHS20C21_18610 [Gemmatimonadota bacterium]